jgi:hypothetical protein
MSAEALTWAMLTDRVGDPIDRLILIYAADGADQDHRSSMSSWVLLERWTGLDSAQLCAALEALAERGLFAIEYVGEVGYFTGDGLGMVLALDVEDGSLRAETSA